MSAGKTMRCKLASQVTNASSEGKAKNGVIKKQDGKYAKRQRRRRSLGAYGMSVPIGTSHQYNIIHYICHKE